MTGDVTANGLFASDTRIKVSDGMKIGTVHPGYFGSKKKKENRERENKNNLSSPVALLLSLFSKDLSPIIELRCRHSITIGTDITSINISKILIAIEW